MQEKHYSNHKVLSSKILSTPAKALRRFIFRQVKKVIDLVFKFLYFSLLIKHNTNIFNVAGSKKQLSVKWRAENLKGDNYELIDSNPRD